jgi:sulfate adenylyltransferase (ADP) / ATP adenylyltransferase
VVPETLWQLALACSERAESNGALVPLSTESLDLGIDPFVLRRLVSRTPKHLRAEGPKPNPFLPWDPALEVSRLGDSHVVLLNKYPVQRGHLLVIPTSWKPQSGWLEPADWQALVAVHADTQGLWFFNSCAAAGASQPHRHLQLLPRPRQASTCPLEDYYTGLMQRSDALQAAPWRCAISPCPAPLSAEGLAALYLEHCSQLELGHPAHQNAPGHPYNLLLTDRWLVTVRRTQEHCRGFSINALGFAGYLLATSSSDLVWLKAEGPWALLRQVAAPALGGFTVDGHQGADASW